MTNLEYAHLLDTIITENDKAMPRDGEYFARGAITVFLKAARDLLIALERRENLDSVKRIITNKANALRIYTYHHH